MSCLNSQSEGANSGHFCPRHHDLYMEKIEFHKKIFIHKEITGPSQNLVVSQCVLSFFQVEYRVAKERLPPFENKAKFVRKTITIKTHECILCRYGCGLCL